MFQPCLNEGTPSKASVKKVTNAVTFCSVHMFFLRYKSADFRHTRGFYRFTTCNDWLFKTDTDWLRRWLIARSSATRNLKLLFLLSGIFIASAGLADCVWFKGLKAYSLPTPSEQSQNAFCRENASMFWNWGISFAFAVVGYSSVCVLSIPINGCAWYSEVNLFRRCSWFVVCTIMLYGEFVICFCICYMGNFMECHNPR